MLRLLTVLSGLLIADVAFAEPLQVLYVGGGCCHDYQTQKTLIEDGLESRIDCKVTVVHDGGSATDSMIPLYDNVHWHDGYDVVVHHECFAHVKDAEYIDRILAPHRAGLPAVIVHCAVHSYGALQGKTEIAKEWRRFLGVHSNGHGAHYPHEVLNVHGDHPVMQGFGTGWWNPAGELYRVLKLEENTVPLCTSKDQASGKDQVCVWTNQFDKGRVFGTTLGHHNETVGDAKFLDLLARGLQWSVDQPITVEWNAIAAEPQRENLALGKTITASSTQPGNELAHATDGSTSTRWCASNASVPQWIQVDLGEPQTLTGLGIVWESPSQRYRIDVEGSADGKAFRSLIPKTSDQAELDFDAAGIQFVRVTCSKTSGGWVSIRELKVLGTELVDPPKTDGDPAEARILEKIKVPEGFEKTLFAGPPAVNYPVYVAADVDGTVYVSQDKNGSLDRAPNRGSVLRVRDLDGDGRADEVKRFVENVDSPRGLVFDRDRVYLMHPPHLSAFIDNDGDGVADEQKILIKNIAFGFEDRPADHTSNGVTLGIDGWLYLAIGDFGFMEAEGADGTKLQMRGGGVVRVRPDGSGMHIYSRGTRNILEVAVSPRLEAFARDNTNDGGGWDVRLHHFTGGEDHGYPRKYKNFADEIVAPLADYGGGSGCGAGWIDEPGWPTDWNDGLYTADWGRGKVFHHPLTPNGATFAAEQRDFVSVPRATDIDVDAAGNAYISSWDGGSFTYKDENIGYVVRVRPKGLDAEEQLAPMSKWEPSALVEGLKSASHRIRLACQRELLAQGWNESAQRKLIAIAADKKQDLDARLAALFTLSLGQSGVPEGLLEITDLERYLIHAIGNRNDMITEDIARRLWFSEDERDFVALSSFEAFHGLVSNNLSLMMRLSYADPLVRHTAREALIANDAAGRALEFFRPGRWYVAPINVDDVKPNGGPYQNANARSELMERESALALSAIHTSANVAKLVEILKNERGIPERRHLAFFALARLVHKEGEWTGKSWGTRPDNAGPYYSFARWEESDRIENALRVAVKTASSDALPEMLTALSKNQVQLDDTLRTVIAAAQNDTAIWPAAAAQLAKAERLPEGAVPLLVRIVDDKTMSSKALASSAEALLSADGSEAFSAAINALSRLGDALNQPTGREALGKLKRSETLERHVDAITASASEDSPTAAWSNLALLLLRNDKSASKESKAKAKSAYAAALESEPGRQRLLDAIDLQPKWKNFNPAIVELARLDGPAGDLARALASRKGLKIGPSLEGPPIKGSPIADLITKMAKPTQNVTAGQAVFSKLTCSKCHSVSPSEPSRGPELSNAARIYKRQQLAEAILDPNKSIAQGFATNVFIMADGRVLTGFVVKEADADVTIRDDKGKEYILKTDDIDDRVLQTQSIMPAGLVDQLSEAEFAALLDYLSSLGS